MVDRIEDLLVQFDQTGARLAQVAVAFGQTSHAGPVGLGQ